MITKFSMAVVFAVLFGSPSFAQDAGSQKFLKEAIEGNLVEAEMGKLSQLLVDHMGLLLDKVASRNHFGSPPLIGAFDWDDPTANELVSRDQKWAGRDNGTACEP